MTWSDEMYNIFGVDKDNFLPHANKLTDFLHPDDKHVLSDEGFAAAMKTKNHQLRFRIIDGTTGAIKHIFFGERQHLTMMGFRSVFLA